MALSVNLVDVVAVTTGAATATLATQPADNCHTITVYNEDSTQAALIGFVGAAVALSGTNGVVIPAGAARTFRVGTAEYRPCGAFGGISGIVLRVKNNGAGTPILNFDFLNSTAPVAP